METMYSFGNYIFFEIKRNDDTGNEQDDMK